MFFFEGKEIFVFKPFVLKVKVLFEEKELFLVEINGKKRKINKKNLLFAVQENNKIIFLNGNSLIHNPVNRIKRFKKRLL
jgi:RNase P/RNase MRP subunit p29